MKNKEKTGSRERLAGAVHQFLLAVKEHGQIKQTIIDAYLVVASLVTGKTPPPKTAATKKSVNAAILSRVADPGRRATVRTYCCIAAHQAGWSVDKGRQANVVKRHAKAKAVAKEALTASSAEAVIDGPDSGLEERLGNLFAGIFSRLRADQVPVAVKAINGALQRVASCRALVLTRKALAA